MLFIKDINYNYCKNYALETYASDSNAVFLKNLYFDEQNHRNRKGCNLRGLPGH